MRITAKSAGAVAFAAVSALALAACGGGGGGASEEAGEDNKPDKLTVAAWMDFPQELLDSF